MANGMGSLYIGVSGLHSAQTALNTTAHTSPTLIQRGIQDSRLRLKI